MTDKSVEKSIGGAETQNRPMIAVEQPHKLGSVLETINLMNTVSERIGESKAGDLGGGGTGQQGDDSARQSKRDQAIANLPGAAVMNVQLQTHIRKEIKVLRKVIRKSARKASKPGAANQLNDLYARMRRLNSLLSELIEASFDVVKRLYIRVFVDKQTAF